MEKRNSEILQTAIFAVILAGNLFLALRYLSRDDIIGSAIFAVVVVLAGIAAAGHLLEYLKTRQK